MTAGKLQEVEVKLYTPDLTPVQRALEEAGATLAKPRVFERNVRYDSADGSLMAQGMVLRLRRDEPATAGAKRNRALTQYEEASQEYTDSGSFSKLAKLTYKADASVEDGIVSRFEAEVVVSDFETMDLILRRLGYEVALIYEKYRRTYVLGDAEIVLDELPYGNFTEIEGDVETIERVIELLGLGGCRRMGGSYTGIFVGLKARLGLEARDCTFAGFAGVDVGDFTTEYTEGTEGV